MPGPRERRVRIKPTLAAAITQHLASVAAALPGGVLGAAFAVELLRALEAALGDHPTLTGETIELFSRLHKRGFSPRSRPTRRGGPPSSCSPNARRSSADFTTVCAVIEVYFVRVDDPRAQHAHAAAELGSEFLAKVCREALDLRGGVREHIEAEFMDAMTDVFVLERIAVLEPDASRPVLQGMFVQALFSTLSRGMDIVFIHAEPGELSFWRDTVGARQVGDLIAASGARRLPVYSKPPSAAPTRSALPRLRVVGRPRQTN